MRLRTPIIITVFIGLLNAGFSSDAEKAWYSIALRKKADKNNAAFLYVENEPNLPNALLYGDSISIGYTPATRDALKGKANVYRLHVNGGDSSSFIAKMDAMHLTMKPYWKHDWDVIHFNVGLHDLKYVIKGKLDKENGEQVSSLDEYAANLKKIIAYLKRKAPNAKLIFATTTPVPEGEAGRHAGDAARYNAKALEVLESYPEIGVNDLYGFTKPNQPQWWTRPGNVHFNSTGVKAQGEEVARVVAKVLKSK
jgi:lysophospholipase L1-like esterase